MRIDVMPVMPADLVDEAWRFYLGAFEELRVQAALRQVLHRHEFDALTSNPRFDKYICRDSTTVVGMAVMTNDLDAVSDISPEYFAHRWPELYAGRRIFYIEFVAAQRGATGIGVYVQLIRRILEPVIASDGVAVADICTHNEVTNNLPDKFSLAARRVMSGARAQRLDAQSFWLYEFPAATPAVSAAG